MSSLAPRQKRLDKIKLDKQTRHHAYRPFLAPEKKRKPTMDHVCGPSREHGPSREKEWNTETCHGNMSTVLRGLLGKGKEKKQRGKIEHHVCFLPRSRTERKRESEWVRERERERERREKLMKNGNHIRVEPVVHVPICLCVVCVCVCVCACVSSLTP